MMVKDFQKEVNLKEFWCQAYFDELINKGNNEKQSFIESVFGEERKNSKLFNTDFLSLKFFVEMHFKVITKQK